MLVLVPIADKNSRLFNSVDNLLLPSTMSTIVAIPDDDAPMLAGERAPVRPTLRRRRLCIISAFVAVAAVLLAAAIVYSPASPARAQSRCALPDSDSNDGAPPLKKRPGLIDCDSVVRTIKIYGAFATDELPADCSGNIDAELCTLAKQSGYASYEEYYVAYCVEEGKLMNVPQVENCNNVARHYWPAFDVLDFTSIDNTAVKFDADSPPAASGDVYVIVNVTTLQAASTWQEQLKLVNMLFGCLSPNKLVFSGLYFITA